VNKLVEYLKNNPMVAIGGIAVLLVVYTMFFRNENKMTFISPTGQKSGNITTEQRLYNEIEGLREELNNVQEQLEKERQRREVERDKARKEPEKKAKKQKTLTSIVNQYTPKVQLKKNTVRKSQKAKPTIVAPAPPKPHILTRLSFKEEGHKKLTATINREQGGSRGDSDLFLPAGSSVEVKLTFGVLAPAGGKAYPVIGVIKRIALGPNKSSIPVRGCQIIGKAKGNIGYRIAEVQVTRISCVWPDGTVHESKINGFLGAKNGMFGVPGRVERFEKEFFETQGVSAFLAGLGEGLRYAQEESSAQYSNDYTQTLSGVKGSPYEYGAYAGLEAMMKAADQFYAKQNTGLVPAVIIEPGQDVVMGVLEGIKIKGGRKNVIEDSSDYYFDSYNLVSR